MIVRGDIQGRLAPRWLSALIVRRYGRTVFGEPRYRLVWAPSRFERSGGEWVDWLEGSTAKERQAGAVQPWRRRTELRWVRKYPGEACWLIERWAPASAFGTPERWYRPVAEGGTVLSTATGPIGSLGDYPQFGDYEDIGARMTWYPTERHVTLAIDVAERQRALLAATEAGRARHRVERAEREQEQRDREFDALAADVFDDASPAFAGAPMVGYGGSHRPALVEMAERIGIRQHPI